jgi:nucleotide-binding universal stress UspA family protein
MAKRILVPLDRMPETERILPIVADLTRGTGAVVRLMHVAPVPGNWSDAGGRTIAYTDQEMDRLTAEGIDYLDALKPLLDGVGVEAVVRFGDPAAEILQEADAFGADLIAVTTASRSKLARLLLGSVAEGVFQKARPAVLLLRPAR